MAEQRAGYSVRVGFDPAVHTQGALLRVAYSFADRIVLDLAKEADHFVLSGKAKSATDVEAITDELRVAAVDFELRQQIESQTQELRNAIWRTAFAELRGAGR